MTESEKMAITKYDLMYEQRMTRVEGSLENLEKSFNAIREDVKEIKKDIKSDFRWLLGIIIGGNASLFALMAHGFKWF